ncbi:NtaA/DmoA family FMN-dependent monooxygenase [Mycobacterium sp. 21AC1]|uniref:NtaA/DmoA family FMN-dependent monooxygenase n=1 Tax=[Mycobacterium] appelbergii TaxID=2939269 RepID=UPI0029391007|nr:NtaA/DmoA family FMN-dependent monooxygenase [Mycobacterium sp. 21AC1]MDV3124988.1 NtaA/DmoA family FMN-dependent monooxygenase [Mycobacterium sp. 21AC1]
MTGPTQLHLNLNLLATGRHDQAWRTVPGKVTPVDVSHFREIAQIAERGRFDSLFLADSLALEGEAYRRPWRALDPVVLFSALSQATERIGFIATINALFAEPFSIARQVSSLDHISDGRAGWNIVTSLNPSTQANYSQVGAIDHADRYRKARESVEVVHALWRSFDPDALRSDLQSGTYLDPEKVHRIDHNGDFFSVTGPFILPRTPQDRPVIVQAGDSEQLRDMAGRWADAIFTVQRDIGASREFARDAKRRATTHGRRPSDLKILPGLFVVVGGTEAEALDRKAEIDAYVDVETERERLAQRIGSDAKLLVLDKPVPAAVLDSPRTGTSASPAFAKALVAQSNSEGLTVRDLLTSNPGGHRYLVGSPESVADNLEHWFREGAADGFNLNIDRLPDGLSAFVDHVVPILQRRGIFRREYRGATLRDHLSN